jgi:glycine hydroxymethyltransferase
MLNIGDKTDKALSSLLNQEKMRQKKTIDLIASENFAPKSVLALLGSELTNKYSEGYPGARYYPGNSIYDKIELLAQSRARQLFKLSEKKWHVNVQPYSGAIANLAIYSAFISPGDKILSLGLTAGGHLSHGSRVSLSGKLYSVVNYNVDKSYKISYSEIEFLAKKIKSKVIVSGASAYPGKIDFEKISKIALKYGALHLADISHYAGLISAKKYPSPFNSADVVMTTTHKSLFGPRAAVIFLNKESRIFRKMKIDATRMLDKAVFPGLQGGPHNNVIAAIAEGMRLSALTESKKYYGQVLKNSKAMCSELKKLGFEIVGEGTESHMFLIKTTALGLNGAEAEKILEKGGILANRNTIFGDLSPLKPSAIRIGTYAVTTMGMKEEEMKKIAGFIHGILMEGESSINLDEIKEDVIKLCKKFPI